MIANDLLSWYEANLPARERKVRGHFSTPTQLVEQMLDACNYTPDKDLSHIRVLDPACGSGNFLVTAARRLIASSKQADMSAAMLTALIQRNIWGLDPDPVACFLAEMQLQALLSAELQCDDSQQPTRRLHIHQADGLAMPWETSGNVDLFLANPPYLAAKNNDLSGYLSARQRGQSDSYLLFLNLALQIVRPDGWLALVLPDPVLARTNAAKERQRLLAETTIYHLWHLANVFHAHVGAVVIIAQKRPPDSTHQVIWKRERWRHSILTDAEQPELHSKEQEHVAPPQQQRQTIAQALFSQQPRAELRYLLRNSRKTLVERIHIHLHEPPTCETRRSLTMLGDCVVIRRGEELGKNSPLLSNNALDNGTQWYPLIRGGMDIHPYQIPLAQYWIAHTAIQKPLEHYLAPKLLVVKSMPRLQATLDLQGHIVLQTLYLLQLRSKSFSEQETSIQAQQDEGELYFLLALLNSRVLREYVYTFHTAYKWVQPQIEQYVLAHLPIPIDADPSEKAQIIHRARLLTQACSEVSAVVELKEHIKKMHEEQESAICALYEAALAKTRQLVPSQHVIDEGVTLHV